MKYGSRDTPVMTPKSVIKGLIKKISLKKANKIKFKLLNTVNYNHTTCLTATQLAHLRLFFLHVHIFVFSFTFCSFGNELYMFHATKLGTRTSSIHLMNTLAREEWQTTGKDKTVCIYFFKLYSSMGFF